MSLRIASIALALAAVACSDRQPVRLVAGRGDTIIVNGRLPVVLPVYGIDARGRRRPVRGARFEWVGGDSLSISRDGVMSCDRRRDAVARATSGTLATQFRVLCRPVRGLSMTPSIWLTVGGPPQLVRFTAVGMDGQTESVLVGDETVRDAAIASIDTGFLTGKTPGVTNVDVHAGDCTGSILVEVDERVDSPAALQPSQAFMVAPLRLAAGEIRSWRLAPGPYEVWFSGDDTEPNGLKFGTVAVNCAPWGDGRLTCVAMANASLVVRNMELVGGKMLTGAFMVRRRFDPSLNMTRATWTQRNVGPPRSPGRRLPPGWCDTRHARIVASADSTGTTPR